MPRVRLSGGAGSGDGGVSDDSGLGENWGLEGDLGPVRTGRSDIGDGGTKGKDSRIESAFVDAVENPEAFESRCC